MMQLFSLMQVHKVPDSDPRLICATIYNSQVMEAT